MDVTSTVRAMIEAEQRCVYPLIFRCIVQRCVYALTFRCVVVVGGQDRAGGDNAKDELIYASPLPTGLAVDAARHAWLLLSHLISA